MTPARRERIFERAWLRPRSVREMEKEHKELLGTFERYAERWESDRRGLRTIDVERPFFVAQGSGVLTGRIDFVRECEDRLEIVEFKYHRNRNPMMRDYPRRQPEHYALAYPDSAPRLVVHYLRDDIEEEIPQRGCGPVRKDLQQVFDHIARGDFDPVPKRDACRLCPVRSACHTSLAA